MRLGSHEAGPGRCGTGLSNRCRAGQPTRIGPSALQRTLQPTAFSAKRLRACGASAARRSFNWPA
jgi:hypothetical protein